jgi:hypothetical protein
MTESQTGGQIKIDATGLTTELLLIEMLQAFRSGNRLSFLVPPNDGPAIVQRIRMRLARLRKQMDEKGKPRRYFRLTARFFPYTNSQGNRLQCVVLQEIRTKHHELTESIERMLTHADAGGNARGQETGQSTHTNSGDK